MNLKLFTILLINILAMANMEMFSEDSCDADDNAMAEWYRQIYLYVKSNQNTSHYVQQLNNKWELQNQATNEKIEQILKEQENQQAQLLKTVNLMEKLQQMEKQLKELHDKSNGNIVIQRRQDGSVDFFRPWNEYKQGFGNENGEFFIGLEKLHKLTNSRHYALMIVLEDWENDRRYAKYNQFIVGSEKELYTLKSLGTYSGSAGDSLSTQLGQKFSTKDQDNDSAGTEHCAVKYTGAWWYSACHESNLNGRYLQGAVTDYASSVVWYKFKGHNYSLKFAEMTLIPQ